MAGNNNADIDFLKSVLAEAIRFKAKYEHAAPSDLVDVDGPTETSTDMERCARLADRHGFDGNRFRRLSEIPKDNYQAYSETESFLQHVITTLPRLIATIEEGGRSLPVAEPSAEVMGSIGQVPATEPHVAELEADAANTAKAPQHVENGLDQKDVEPSSPSHDEGRRSPSNIADIYKVPKEAVRKQLERWRVKHPNESGRGWIENPDRAPNEPKFLYKVSSVSQIIEGLVNGNRVDQQVTSEKKTSP